MTPNEIRGAMVTAGTTGRAIAKKFNISGQAVSNVIYGKSKSPRVRAAIANAISRQVDEIWPDNNKSSVE